MPHQKGEDPEILAAKKREMEVKRAAAASKSTKTYYKVTVKVGAPAAAVTGTLGHNVLLLSQAQQCWTRWVMHGGAVQDNGIGMPHKDIPNLLGRVLSGTKYGVKQTRGKFGLGAKMALIWSKMSTGLPIEIWSARAGQAFISHYKLDLDIHK